MGKNLLITQEPKSACYICGNSIGDSLHFWHRLKLCSQLCLDIMHEKNDTESNRVPKNKILEDEY